MSIQLYWNILSAQLVQKLTTRALYINFIRCAFTGLNCWAMFRRSDNLPRRHSSSNERCWTTYI